MLPSFYIFIDLTFQKLLLYNKGDVDKYKSKVV